MPTDPKWRTIARASGATISEVQAVWNHVMVNASANATERGRTSNFSFEDVASSLDLETARVEAIWTAMQGRTLEGDRLLNWEKRNPKREDGSAERAKAWREEKKNASGGKRTQANAGERNETLDESREEVDGEQKQNPHAVGGADSAGGTRTPAPTLAGRACLAMRQAGLPAHAVNPSNATLLDALDEGVTPEMLADAARMALVASPVPTNPFAWAIAAARGEHSKRGKTKPPARAPPVARPNNVTQDFNDIDYGSQVPP